MTARDYQLFGRYVSIITGELVLDGLDATFHIEKNIKGAPNSCELLVYNLNEDHRKALQGLKNVKVQIRAGYKGLKDAAGNTAASTSDDFLIFNGDITQIFSQTQGPDWVTTLRTADGIDSVQKSILSQTFKKGRQIKDIVGALLGGVQVDSASALKKIQSGDIPGTLSTVLNSHTLFGSVHRELDQHFKKLGVDGFIDNNELVVLKKGETRGTERIELSPTSGLIGSPEIGNDGSLHCKSLLRPEFSLGHQLYVKSASIEGNYRIERITYSGSTFGEEWYCDLECTAL